MKAGWTVNDPHFARLAVGRIDTRQNCEFVSNSFLFFFNVHTPIILLLSSMSRGRLQLFSRFDSFILGETSDQRCHIGPARRRRKSLRTNDLGR